MTKIKRRYEFCMYCGGEIVFKYIRNEGKYIADHMLSRDLLIYKKC